MSLIDDFLKAAGQVKDNAVNTAETGVGYLANAMDPGMQQMSNSPIGQLVQGKFSNVVPALQEEVTKGTIAGKPYNPQMMIGGEMEETPGAGFDPATGMPKPAAQGAELPPTQSNPQKSLNSTTRIRLKPSVYGAGKEAAVQNTIDTHLPGATATEQYANLEPTMDLFGKQIQNKMSANPKSASMDLLMSDYDRNLNDAGIYRTAEGTKSTVKSVAQGYVNKLFNLAANEQDPSSPVPINISDNSLYEARQAISQDAKSVYRKIENGTSLTDKDRVVLAAGQTIDDSLSQLHPEVKDLITKQSHLYQAADPLFDARDAEIKANAKEEAANAGVPPWLRGIKTAYGKQPFLLREAEKVGAGILGFNELKNLPNQMGSVAGLATSAVSNLQNKSTPSPTQNTSAKYNISTPLDDGTLISNDKQTARQNALNTKMGAEKLGDPQAYNTDSATYQNNELEYNNQANLRKASMDTNTVMSTANNAVSAVNAADPSFINTLSQGYDALSKANGGKYSAMASYLENLENLTGAPLKYATSKESLLAGIDAAVKSQQNKLNTAKTQYSGSINNNPAPTSTPTSSNLPPTQANPVNWQQNDPRVQAILGTQ